MKKISLLAFIFVAFLFNIYFVQNVKAYEEGTFEDEDCISQEQWESALKSATVDYTFDKQSGKFSTEGKQKYTDFESNYKEKDTYIVFYTTSSDGKTLYAYVPSYDGVKDAPDMNTMLSDRGISTTSSCDGDESIYIVSKTAQGTEYSCQIVEDTYYDQNGMEVSESEYNEACNGSNENGTNTNSGSNGSESKDDGYVEKDVANTASAASIIGIVVGAIMIGGAGYVIYTKYKKNQA